MRRCVGLVVLAVLLLGPAADAAPRKASPKQALGALQRAVQRHDYAAEWATLSPGFKRRMSRQAGRNVDVGDYVAARMAHRRDKRVRELEQWLPSASIERIRYDGKGRADVWVRFGAPLILGKTIKVQMIHHRLWELFVKGERQPYWGFADDKALRAVRAKDGTVTVTGRDKKGKVTFRQAFKPHQIRAFHSTTRWYFHSFGEHEKSFFK